MDRADITDIADVKNIAVITVPQKTVQAVVSAALSVGTANTTTTDIISRNSRRTFCLPLFPRD